MLEGKSLTKYRKEIEKLDIYTPEEERLVFDKYQKKPTKELKEEIIKHYLRWVYRLGIDFSLKYRYNDEDLIQEGNIALIKCIDKFNPDEGVKFTSYLTTAVENSMRRCVMFDKNLIRLSRRTYFRMWNMYYSKERLLERLGRIPTTEELIEEMNDQHKQLTDEDIKLLEVLNNKILSLNTSIDDNNIIDDISSKLDMSHNEVIRVLDKNTIEDKAFDEEIELIDFLISDDDNAEDIVIKQEQEKVIDKIISNEIKSGLSERQRKVLQLYYGINTYEHTHEEIGPLLTSDKNPNGVSREISSKERKTAIKILRDNKNIRGLL